MVDADAEAAVEASAAGATVAGRTEAKVMTPPKIVVTGNSA